MKPDPNPLEGLGPASRRKFARLYTLPLDSAPTRLARPYSGWDTDSEPESQTRAKETEVIIRPHDIINFLEVESDIIIVRIWDGMH